jgi:hypothetical protein
MMEVRNFAGGIGRNSSIKTKPREDGREESCRQYKLAKEDRRGVPSSA